MKQQLEQFKNAQKNEISATLGDFHDFMKDVAEQAFECVAICHIISITQLVDHSLVALLFGPRRLFWSNDTPWLDRRSMRGETRTSLEKVKTLAEIRNWLSSFLSTGLSW